MIIAFGNIVMPVPNCLVGVSHNTNIIPL
jgi:hypothetical protein